MSTKESPRAALTVPYETDDEQRLAAIVFKVVRQCGWVSERVRVVLRGNRRGAWKVEVRQVPVSDSLIDIGIRPDSLYELVDKLISKTGAPCVIIQSMSEQADRSGQSRSR